MPLLDEKKEFWEGRTENIKKLIDESFDKINKSSKSSWGLYNGQEKYGIAHFDDYLVVMEYIIAGLKLDQKEFNFMDIGAGNFQWGNGLAKYLDNNPLFKGLDVKFNIFSIRGEPNHDQEVKKGERCTLYNYGRFKIENLIDEFYNKGRDLNEKIDLAVSSWCLRHLVDPTGTFVQINKQLRPDRGVFFFDGFLSKIGDENKEKSVESNVYSLLNDSQATFFVNYDSAGRRANCFVTKKSEIETLHLSYKTKNDTAEVKNYQVGSEVAVFFDCSDLQLYKNNEINQQSSSVTIGNSRYFYKDKKSEYFFNQQLNCDNVKNAIFETFEREDRSNGKEIIQSMLVDLINGNRFKKALEIIDEMISINISKLKKILQGSNLVLQSLQEGYIFHDLEGEEGLDKKSWSQKLIEKIVNLSDREALENKSLKDFAKQMKDDVLQKAIEGRIKKLELPNSFMRPFANEYRKKIDTLSRTSNPPCQFK